VAATIVVDMVCWNTSPDLEGHLEGGGCCQCLTMMQAPKQKKCWLAISEGAMAPSRSSNTITREDDNLGWNRCGGLTQEGN
jgi:hypothetical protein